MASVYGYTTIALLEAYTSEDYGSMIRPITDAEVDAKITNAEYIINAYLGTTFTGTIPDSVIYCTNDIARRMLYRWMREHGMKLDKEKVLEASKPYVTDDIKDILDFIKDQYSTKRTLYITRSARVGSYYPRRT